MIQSDNFAIQTPICGTSFGNIGISILRECFNRGLNPNIFVIGQPSLNEQKKDEKFEQWLNFNINKALKTHNRKDPVFKIWHGNFDCYSSLSENETLLTFLETDRITEYEKNILSQKKTVFVTSDYLKSVMESGGVNNVKYLQLGFDSFNFYQNGKKYWYDDRIVMNVVGKYEWRKAHKKAIQAWLKKYGVPKVGVRPRYVLQCAIYNPFLVERTPDGRVIDHNPEAWRDITAGKEYANINFLPWLPGNANYNDFLLSSHAVIGMGNENVGMAELHSTALGKHNVILNANGYKDWASPLNSCLVEPYGMRNSVDNIFFRPNQPFQQGDFFDWREEDFIAKLEECVKRIESNPINTEGLKLQERTYAQTLDTILQHL